VIAHVPDATAEDVDRAAKAARQAFESGSWASMTAQGRGRILFRLAEKIRSEMPKLAELESRNGGKPIVEAEFDIKRRRHLLRNTYGGPRYEDSGPRQSRCPITLSAFHCANRSAWLARSFPGITRCCVRRGSLLRHWQRDAHAC